MLLQLLVYLVMGKHMSSLTTGFLEDMWLQRSKTFGLY